VYIEILGIVAFVACFVAASLRLEKEYALFLRIEVQLLTSPPPQSTTLSSPGIPGLRHEVSA
jgi:hypothetical protein